MPILTLLGSAISLPSLQDLLERARRLRCHSGSRILGRHRRASRIPAYRLKARQKRALQRRRHRMRCQPGCVMRGRPSHRLTAFRIGFRQNPAARPRHHLNCRPGSRRSADDAPCHRYACLASRPSRRLWRRQQHQRRCACLAKVLLLAGAPTSSAESILPGYSPAAGRRLESSLLGLQAEPSAGRRRISGEHPCLATVWRQLAADAPAVPPAEPRGDARCYAASLAK